MFAALKKQPKHIKIALGVLILLVIGSLAIQPDKDFKMEGVTVSKETISLEEAKRQDEIYREKIRRQELGLEPVPGAKENKNGNAKATADKSKAKAKPIAKKSNPKKTKEVKKPKAKQEKVAKNTKTPSKASAKENQNKKEPEKTEKVEKEKILAVAQKTKEIHRRRVADKKNMQRITNLINRAPASMTEIFPGLSENENNHFYILVRGSDYFDTKIFVNQKTRIDVSGNNEIQSFPIPSEVVSSQNLVDICYFHNDKTGKPGVKEMVRVEILNTEEWPQERMPAMLNSLHVNPLRVSLSPTGKDFQAGNLNCESLYF